MTTAPHSNLAAFILPVAACPPQASTSKTSPLSHARLLLSARFLAQSAPLLQQQIHRRPQRILHPLSCIPRMTFQTSSPAMCKVCRRPRPHWSVNLPWLPLPPCHHTDYSLSNPSHPSSAFSLRRASTTPQCIQDY